MVTLSGRRERLFGSVTKEALRYVQIKRSLLRKESYGPELMTLGYGFETQGDDS